MARCEDYPCCGHGQEGCEDRPEFHSEYWHELHERLGDELYEQYLELLEWNEG